MASPSAAEKIIFTDNGKERTTDWQEILAAAKRMSEFFRVVQSRFVERDELVRILKYAMLLREHILLYGGPGTAKTAIADMVIKNIESADSWSCDLSQFMSETRLFGDFDIKKANESGQLMHRTEGSILMAHFANLGEFLDANVALLRSLLRVLNEREFIRGPQKMKVPLMTALANTNTDPTAAQDRHKELEAVLDRFLFWHRVDYVQLPENRLRMLKMFKANKYMDPLPPLSIDDVLLVSGAVLQLDLLQNEFILQAYEELARTFAAERKRIITDRRLNKGLQIMDASAILDGATEVDWDDLDRVSLVFVDRPDELELFQQVLAKVKDKWRSAETQAQVSQEDLALDGLAAKMSTSNLEQATEAELVTMKRDLLRLEREVNGFATTSAGGKAKKQQVLEAITNRTLAIQKLIDKVE